MKLHLMKCSAAILVFWLFASAKSKVEIPVDNSSGSRLLGTRRSKSEMRRGAYA